ncbi:MAG: phenylalanine--tRNA ligase subunit beta [Bdellovibrionales bacterium]
MKFTLSWLKDYLETDATLEALCDKLTAIGLEIESLENPAASLAPFKVAQVISAEKHPQADRLKLCVVDTGVEKIQVVCGAPNARAGIKVVLARPGDVIPVTGEALKLSKIRGEESQGMMCSEAELKLSDSHEGIMELAADAPLGARYIDVVDVADPVIEINLTPNRGDCAGVYGVARDLAAAGMGTLKPMKIRSEQGTEKSRINVLLELPEGQKQSCPHFVGRMIRNVKNGPSPSWLQQRLRAIGMRPISALVDITNYLTYDCGRPLHVFDAGAIKGDLWVRAATGGEAFEALNDKTYELAEGMTIIGDDTGILSLAGVMGGPSSGCEDDTRDVFIESAYFDPTRTAMTGRALGLMSDARYRFERGVDPAFTEDGADLAMQMVLELCGTELTIISEKLIVGSAPHVGKTVCYRPSMCQTFIGVDVSEDEQQQILTALGFKVDASSQEWQITAPSWRGDVDRAADITEEIVRIKGYDAIPATSMPRDEVITVGALPLPDHRAGKAKRTFAARGLLEAVTWSFMPSKIAAHFGEIKDELRLINPISADLDVMRSSMVGNLVQVAGRNIDRGYGDVGVFEVGNVFWGQKPEEQILSACALRAGTTGKHWAEETRKVDVYDAKADAQAALVAAGAPDNMPVFDEAPSYYHPGRSGSFRLGKNLLGHFGELHPAVLESCGVQGPVVACELYLNEIPQSRQTGTARNLLKLEPLQPVSRDFAFLMDEDALADKLLKAIRSADKTLISDVVIFDVYQGKGVEEGKKSVAVSVTLQPQGAALTEAALEGVSAKIVGAVTKATGGVLRG